MIIKGTTGNDNLVGTDQDDTISGGTGADIMSGGNGNDTYFVDNANDVVNESPNSGIDTVISSVSWALTDDIENLTLGGNAMYGYGNALDNVLTGNDHDNILNGNGGNDTMIGGKGNDIYMVEEAGDKVVETLSAAQGGGIDTVFTSFTDYSLTGLDNVENLTYVGRWDFHGTGNALNNVIQGDEGNDVIDGGTGADVMQGHGGDDTYYVDNVHDTITQEWAGTDTVISSIALTKAFDNVENYVFQTDAAVNFTGNDLNNAITGGSGTDTLHGGNGSDTIHGGAGNDLLFGDNGNDTLIGDGGSDHLVGGNGNDIYYVDDAGDYVTETATGGVADIVESSVTVGHLWDNVESLALTGEASINATGNVMDNLIWGNSGNNVIDGGKGADIMFGGKGDDTYYVDNTSDSVIENANEGTDSVIASASFTLAFAANVENLTLTGTAQFAIGNALDNVLIGNDTANILSGDLGDDTMTGGKGDDLYFVDSAGDKVIEDAGGGIDTVYAELSEYSLAGLGNIENLTFMGYWDHHGTGNALDNVIVGDSGNDVIDGGLGADDMQGGTGDDTYYVDNAHDTVTHDYSGTDTVISSIALTTGFDPVENYVFQTGDAVKFAGNALDNAITGGSGDDQLSGVTGNDVLHGGAGNDTLLGGSGNDTLYGDGGNDVMVGGNGSDTYYVDSTGDTVDEKGSDGFDVVHTSVSLPMLVDGIEVVYLDGGNLNVTGNGQANALYGSSGDNVIAGGGGSDMIVGGGGNDTLIGGSGADRLVFDLHQNAGHDTISDFVKAQDILEFEVMDLNGDGKTDLKDLLASISNVTDHGVGKDVDVTFIDGAEITFTGAGTNAVHSITNLVADPATQIHVS